MMYPTSDQLIRIAERVAKAERTEVTNHMLMMGLRPTNEEMDQIHTLVFLAIKSGDTSAFLHAAGAIIQKPLFIPCSCWWCKLKRRFQKVTRKWQ